ncbi:unnamed protein product [Cercopithifilaria johnstoni]|uniref:Uncharacterized protein n=1 Tax=Cercopithifilaria johnstoni TaxID=2874296 RepID=A0A8J2M8S1_9BILA|nr:unnamed protein product [Cercopithifilaria johnstoni]
MQNILILLITSGCFAEGLMNSIAFTGEWNETETANLTDFSIGKTSMQQELPELLFVYIIWRHGDRGPLAIYPNDPHKESVWPNGIGELTEIGMQQLFKVGTRLYQQYINCTPPFLSRNYHNREIYIRSTDVNRTITSAMAVLAGMFPNGIAGKDYPRESDKINWPHGWVPIPVHTVELKYDHIANPFHHCTRAQILENEGYQSNDFRNIIVKYQDLLAYLSNVTGYQKFQLDERLNFILDILTVERFHNLKLPEWFTTNIEKEMQILLREMRKYQFGNAKYFGSNSRLIRLRGGAILNGIVDKLRRKWECLNSDRTKCAWYKHIKFYGLSAHDVTISALLVALGPNFENMDIYNPQYGATVSFELYQFNNQPYIKVCYLNYLIEELL